MASCIYCTHASLIKCRRFCVFTIKGEFTALCYSQCKRVTTSYSAEPPQMKSQSIDKCYAARVSPLMNHLLGHADVVARVLSHPAAAEESFPWSPGVLESP